MFDFVRRWLSSPPRVSLDSLRFDASGYRRQEEVRTQGVWFTPEGDGVGLQLFLSRTHVPSCGSIASLRDQVKSDFEQTPGTRLIEVELPQVACGLRVIRMVFRAQLPEGGAIYVGSLMVPFERFSFLLKVQCEEAGMTGVREALLLDRALRDGTVQVGEAGPDLSAFSPYGAKDDDEFPEHPLTRLRRTLLHLQQTLELDADLADAPRFELPTV